MTKISFNSHIKELCKRANNKTKALLRIRNKLNQQKTDLLFNSFILSNFNYSPLVWMFCDKASDILINKTLRRAMCVKENRFRVSSNTLIHIRNLRLLMIEVYKALNQVSPQIMWDTFKKTLLVII